jgi:hypothetical protein
MGMLWGRTPFLVWIPPVEAKRTQKERGGIGIMSPAPLTRLGFSDDTAVEAAWQGFGLKGNLARDPGPL